MNQRLWLIQFCVPNIKKNKTKQNERYMAFGKGIPLLSISFKEYTELYTQIYEQGHLSWYL